MGKNFNNNRNYDNHGGNRGNNNRKGGYNNRRNNNFDPVLQAQKEERARELAERRANDYNLLKQVCEILDGRVETVKLLKVAGQLNRENSKIGMVDIHNYYAENNLGEFPGRNNVSFLINVLIDLARAQTNTRIDNWQIATKNLYFYERFISHFSNKFINPTELFGEFRNLFDSRDIVSMAFEDKGGCICGIDFVSHDTEVEVNDNVDTATVETEVEKCEETAE